jgi:hypothetical protein
MGTVGRVFSVLFGVWMAGAILMSAVRSVVLPRGEPVLLTRAVFLTVRRLFDIRVNRQKTYEGRDRAMALYAPISLVLLPFTWVALTIVAFTAIFWGLGTNPLGLAVRESGSSLLTLGFVVPANVQTEAAVFIEATLGLGLIALLISYLPSIYAAFQRRELAVALLATRAGEPPSAGEMIIRHYRLERLDALDEIWDDWETWFADIEETHTSQPSLVFFRSISHERSWITSAGVVLDCAALRSAVLDLPSNPRAQLCIRAGYLSLRRIAGYFDIPYPTDPSPDDPISIDRSEFDAVLDELAAAGVPLKTDRDQLWRDFAGWRVNYDAPLIALAGLTMAPYAPWSSDRSFRPQRPSMRPAVLRRRQRSRA